MKKENLLNLFILIGTAALIFAYLITNRLFYQDMAFLELFYLASSMVFLLLPGNSINLPCTIIRITGIIRYVLFPIMVYENKEMPFYFEPNVRFLMIIEILVVHFIVLFYYHSNFYYNTELESSNDFELNTNIIPMQLGLTTVVVVALGGLILVLNPKLLMNYFVFNFSDKAASSVGGAGAILIQMTIFFAFVSILTIIQKNHFLPEKIKILISFVLVLIYSNGKGVTAANVSRWGVLVGLVSGIVFIFSLYPKAKKTIFRLTIVVVPLVIIFSTLLKQEMWGNTTTGLDGVLSVKSLNGYFSGSYNMKKGLALVNSVEKDTARTILADTFANFPMLNHFVDISATTATKFNYVYYRSSIARDQICPMIIQFMSYFGYLGVIPYGIVVFCGLHFYTLSGSKNSLLEKNIFIILAFYFSLVFCLNWSILLEVIWIQVLPLALVNSFNIKIKNTGA